ncbi:neuromedin Bb [Chanos chanos]|uniref:Neuromedin Bb n=1 Tax=Chanos chanos TaxID=29144 RepID=A0A6J2UPJ5_CHACN|nr:neuromedin-B-like [Chanos chanos]
MSSFTLHSFCQFGFLTYLMLSSYISVTSSVSLDLTELRNKVAKIKVSPRGNLWATGHFMGKKSVDDELLPSDNDAAMSAMEVALSPQQTEPNNLYQEVLKIALQAQLDSPESRFKNPETALLMKILGNYVQSNRKW